VRHEPAAGGRNESSVRSMSARVLVADDNPTIRGLYKEILTRQGYDVSVAATASQALDIVRTESIAAVVLDVRMPGDFGGDAVVAAVSAKAPVIVVTGAGDEKLERQVTADGAFAFLRKPFNMVELIEIVRAAVDSRPA
jgi:DNA-binding NtrC family response regulator